MEKSISKKLAPSVIGVWRWAGAAGNAIFLGIPAVYYSFLGMQDVHFWILSALIIAVLVIIILNLTILPPLRWKKWRYSIDQNEIGLLRGILVETETLIPLSRVQHVDTRQGPLLRMFGLSSVTISTAATTHEIPGLDEVIAGRVRRDISTFARLAEEDV